MSETLKHTHSCAEWKLDEHHDCTCGLRYRIELQTEREMHNAWRKRAEEAEAELMAKPEAPRSPAQPDAEALLREARSWLETLMRQRHDVRPNEPVDTTDDLIARIDAFLRGGSNSPKDSSV